MPSSLSPNLVVAAAGGDKDAFGKLVEASYRTVFAIVLAHLGDAPTSEDVTQDVFVEAWRALPTLRRPESYLPWVRQLARHRSLDRARGLARSRLRDAPLTDVSTEPDLDDQLTRQRIDADLRVALDELPTDDREVLVLYYLEEQSSQQVASLLGLSDAATRKRLSRARTRLGATLEGRLGTTLRALPVVAAIAGLMTALPAQAAARSRIGLVTVLAIGAGLLVAALPFAGPGERSTRPHSLPTPVVAASPHPRTPTTTPTPARTAPPRTLDVRIGRFRTPASDGRILPLLVPRDFWPDLDPFDDPDLQAVATCVAADQCADAELDALFIALADRTPTSPWEALVLLEAERQLARIDDVPDTPRDLLGVQARATDAIARWPDHPMADHARIYQLEALSWSDTGTLTPDLLDVFDSDDEVLRMTAARHVGGIRVDACPPQRLPDLEAVLRDFPEQELGIAGLASAVAMHAGDWTAGERWTERYHHAVAERFDDPNLTQTLQSMSENTSSYLAAHHDAEPLNWAAAVLTTARRCALASTPTEVVTGSAIWTGTVWQWHDWSSTTPFTHCMATTTLSPTPDDATTVRLSVRPS